MLSAVLLAISYTVLTLGVLGQVPSGIDVRTYWAEGHALRLGLNPYGPIPGTTAPTTYPIFGVLMLTPLSWVSQAAAPTVMVILNLVALPVVVALAVRLVAGRWDPVAFMLITAVAPWLEPVFYTFTWGQIDLVILGLVLLDRLLPVRFRGTLIGLAAGIKITPGIFVVYLLTTGRTRQAARACLVALATVAIGFMINATASWEFWTRLLFQPDRVASTPAAFNMSLRGVVWHQWNAFPSWVWVLVVLVAVAGLAISTLGYRRGSEVDGMLPCALTMLLVSPVSWNHHWVWVLLLLAYAAARAPWAGVGVALLMSIAFDHVDARGVLWIGIAASALVLIGISAVRTSGRTSVGRHMAPRPLWVVGRWRTDG